MDIILDHPDKIHSLHFSNYDVGANGTRDWNFTRLIESEAVFQNLISFKVQLYLRGDHNTPIITQNQDYSFDNSVTQLLKKMPNIYKFEVPTPADERLFEVVFSNLKRITVQSNYTHGNFIKNLAKSPILSQLDSLDFTDVAFDQELSYRSHKAIEADEYYKRAIAFKKDIIAKTGDKKQADKAFLTKMYQEEGLEAGAIIYELFNADLVALTKEEFIELAHKYEEAEEDIQVSIECFEEKGVWDEVGNYVEPKEEDSLDFDEDFDLANNELNKRTPFEDYKALFKAIDKDNRFHFKLREYYLTQEQLFELDQLNPK